MYILKSYRSLAIHSTMSVISYLSMTGLSFAYDANIVDNVVYINLTAPGYRNVSTTYVIASSSIPKSQDPTHQLEAGASRTYTTNDGKMSFFVGRTATTGVAAFFSQKVPAGGNTFDQSPAALNFAFIGKMTITLTGGTLGSVKNVYTLDNVAFGQGSVGLSNNWWFGGTSCVYTSGYTVKCPGKSESGFEIYFYFTRGGSSVLPHSVDTVYLDRIEYPKYKPYSLQKEFNNENKECKTDLDQPARLCPPYVLYYTPTQAASLMLHNADGLLLNAVDKKFDTAGADISSGNNKAIFVVDMKGNVYASNAHKFAFFIHPTFLAGADVASAGEIEVKQGVLTAMSNCSGHYKPLFDVAKQQFLEALLRIGVRANKDVKYFNCDKYL